MFRRILLLFMMIPILFGFTNRIIACEWDLVPQVLLVTSHKDAQEKPTEDSLMYQKLKSVYGSQAVSVIFSSEDSNTYASILTNLIKRFNLKKVFILDHTLVDYFPKTSSDQIPDTNLVKIVQQFSNVDFYFFNSQIANSVKITNNIYEFRFDSPNKGQSNPNLTYGASIAQHFYQQLVDADGNIDPNKYHFDTDANDGNKWVIKIALIGNKNNSYQNKIAEDFVKNLYLKIPLNSKYKIYPLEVEIPDSSLDMQIIEQEVKYFYENESVNFVFNLNSWYNNAIAHAASSVGSSAKQAKTIKFIANSVSNKDEYLYGDENYMLFSYNLDFSVLEKTIADSVIPEDYQVLDSASENFHAYGLNNNLNFIDSM